jgi:hypothetical protein
MLFILRTHTYATANTYTITCAVTDNDQATARQTATIKVKSQASVAADVGLVSVAVLNGGCDKILYA